MNKLELILSIACGIALGNLYSAIGEFIYALLKKLFTHKKPEYEHLVGSIEFESNGNRPVLYSPNATNAINKTCRNCKYKFTSPSQKPCIKCEYYSEWKKGEEE